MDSARARLYQALHRCDRYGRLRMYHPLTKRGADIYVHAKIMIVDEQLLRVGSSNLNNRSMRLDTECDVVIDATLPQNAEAGERIAAIRTFLMAEHLGVAPQVVEAALQRHGRLSAAIDTLLQGNDRMRAYQVPDMTSVEEWLAHNEILDPESPDEMFEPLANDGLLRNFRL
jgi:phosphatidylserine/phosphatidylglycerophosphate/cardiolipin synthase-like enzyme